MIEEIWRDISGYEGLYQVSNLGRVRSLDFEKHYNPINRKSYTKILKGRVLKPYSGQSNFLKVLLYKDGEIQRKTVHHLVAEAFLENPMGRKMVWFKDGDKTNVKLDNLKWSKYD